MDFATESKLVVKSTFLDFADESPKASRRRFFSDSVLSVSCETYSHEYSFYEASTCASFSEVTSDIESDSDDSNVCEMERESEHLSAQTVQKILQDMYSAQLAVQEYVRQVKREVLRTPVTLEEIHQKLRMVFPNDPLEKYSLSAREFEELLKMYQHDVNVQQSLSQLSAIVPCPGDKELTASSRHSQQGVTVVDVFMVRKLKEVHAFMLEELAYLVQCYSCYNHVRQVREMDDHALTLAVQVAIECKVEARFNITSEDLEQAVVRYHKLLAKDEEFAYVNMKIQDAMGQFMGMPCKP